MNKKTKILIIVESPKKTVTIKNKIKQLSDTNSSFFCMHTKGHLFDLSKNNMGISIDGNNKITLKYIKLKNKQKIIQELTKKIKHMDVVYLTSDPDREGELISFLINNKIIDKLKKKPIVKRLLLHEITLNGLKTGLEKLQDVNKNIVYSQQVRRVYDRLYGFILSYPMSSLFKTMGIGRIQTPVLKEIVSRDREVENFIPQTYYDILCESLYNDYRIKFKNKILERFINLIDIAPHIDFLNKNIKQFTLINIKTTNTKIKRLTFLNTATLLQIACKQGLSHQNVMSILQELYEKGIITYPRTDNKQISDYGRQQTIQHIIKYYGKNLLFTDQKKNTTRSQKFSQNAHECIRITNFSIDLSSQLLTLTPPQTKIFKLIYLHTLAPFMTDVDILNTIFIFEYLDYKLEIISKDIKNIGWWTLTTEKVDKIKKKNIDWREKQEDFHKLMFVSKKKKTKSTHDHYTYSSIVKFMSDSGLGRPSTYGYIVKILLKHKLIHKEKKYLISSNLGRLLYKFISTYWQQDFNVKDTIYLEELIELVCLRKKQRDKVILEVWNKLKKIKLDILNIKHKLQNKEIWIDTSEQKCKSCDSNKLLLKFGMYGQYYNCQNCNKNNSISIDNLVDISKVLNNID